MSAERLRLVIDASVGIQLFISETHSDAVHALFARLSEDPPAEFFVPDLFYIECANILLKFTLRYGRPLADSLADLEDLKQLALRSSPTADLMEDALRLANEKQLTAYDASYAALAHNLGIPILTLDEALLKKIDWAVSMENF